MISDDELIKVSTSQREEIPIAETHLKSASSQKLIEKAVQRNRESARKTARSLGVKILDENISTNIIELPIEQSEAVKEKSIEIQVKAEYHTTKFSEAKLDLKVIALHSKSLFHLFRKEFSTRWYQFRARIANKQQSKKRAVVTSKKIKKALVVGHFSVPGGGGTFGDIESQELVCRWLSQANVEYDVASNLEDGVDGIRLTDVDDTKYSIFIFVCGPWYPYKKIPSLLLERFNHCIKIGINLTIFEEGNAGFDYLLSRDDLENNRVDIAFGCKVEPVPVVGIVLTYRQSAYGNKQRHLYARKIIDEFLEENNVLPVWLDTVVNHNEAGLRSSQEYESLIGKLDIIITNRLHGLVLSLKNSVPVVAIDAIAGGAKVTAQARAFGWPYLIPVEKLDAISLRECVQGCLSTDLSPEIASSQERARQSVQFTKDRFLEILNNIGKD